ncbi:tetratricopeptide repeat protein [Nostoc sp. ChiQUE01b]|uniref:tetratricopeptide repeat protein n=1 Tax=Nostoc sp. ChiQUE01b TaxID=3075376 RepID=UPI002AD25812|nr:tetratricopeptide repeat protein [Nostoc sp. ChiQUE01b]MDZ8263436.1 tetratricopeptide repeat protein [Nostoc sp. ChiQUE01b]
MSNRLKSFALVTLVLSLTCGVGFAASDVIVRHTLARTATSSDSKAEGDKLFEEGVQQFRRGEYPKALQTYQRVLEIRRKLGDQAGIGQTLNNIGQVYNGLLQQEKALEVLQQALTIRREIKDRAGEGETLDNIGGVYLALFKEEEALKTLQQALEIRREVKDKAGEAVTLSRIGLTYTFLKQQDKGLKLLQQALVKHRELGDKYQEGLTLFRIAGAYGNVDDYPNALDWLNKALAVNREVGNRAWEGRCLQQIGYIYFNKKEYDNALKFFQQSLTLIQKAGIRSFEASILTSLGDTYFKQEKYDKAIEFYKQALPVAREIKNKSLESEILASLGDSYRKQDKYDLAIEFYQQALPLTNKNTEQETGILALIGNCYFLQGKYDLAIENYQKSLIIAREIKNLTIEAQTLTVIAGSYDAQKKFEKAIEFYQQALALQQKPLNNRSAQLTILMQIISIYFRSASDLTLQKDYSRVIIQANEALKLVPDTLKLARELNNSTAEKEILQIQSQSYSLIGNYHLQLRELEKAEKFLQQALTIARQSENLEAEKYALSYLGGVYIAQGYNAKAIELGQRELEIARILKNPFFEVRALLGLASTYNVLGDYEQGIQLSQQALTKSEEIDIQKIPENLQKYALQSKPDALGLLSLIYTNLGEYDKALEFAQKRFNLVRSLKNPKLEAEALIRLGDVYNSSQNFQKAIEFTQQALTMARDINNSDLEAQALKQISATYTEKGDYQQALDSAQQILVIAEKTKNSNLKIDALNIQRQVYANQGNYKKALELFQNALSIAKQNSDFGSEWTTLIEIGLFYKTLGDEQKSTEYLQQALTLAQKIQNPQFEGVSLFIIAYTYFGKDQPEKIIEYANRGLAILPKTKIIPVEIIGNTVLSLGYGELKNEQKAMEAAQASLKLARKSKNPSNEKDVLTFIGGLQRKFGKQQEAIKTYNQALAIKIQAKAVGADSGIYAGLGRTFAELNQPNEAIKNYQEAVQRIEVVRSKVQEITPDLQKSFFHTIVDFDGFTPAKVYRQYADLLLKQGRTAEATPIIEILKYLEAQEYFGQTRGIDSTLNDKQIALGKELSQLETIPREKRDNKQQQRIVELRKMQENLIKEYGEFVKSPEVAKRIEELRQLTGGKNLDPDEQARSLQDNLKRLQQDAVIIYPLVLKERLELVLLTPYAPPVRRTVAVSEAELNKTIEDFRRDLQSPGTNAKVNANKLYQWLIQPLEVDLAEAKTKTIIFAPDGKLRYIPLAALHDSKQWLIERFNINNITALSLMDLNTKPQTKREILAAAFTDINRNVTVRLGKETAKFRGLRYAGKEVDEITATISGSTKLLDNQFNKDIVYQMNDYSVVHLATHAAFVDGKPEESVIVLGDGKYVTLRDVKDWNLPNVDLVVLSACETGLGGFGDGKEILGFGYRMQQIGAKAAIASLWKVDDPSTSQLMQLFYKNLATEKMTKSEALRQAQLSLINGNNSSTNPEGRGIEVNIGTSSRNEKPQSGYSHPYYWAPFILIGNGL